MIEQQELSIPPILKPAALKADKNSEAEILSDLATTARNWLTCSVYHKVRGPIRGVLLRRTKDEIHVITKTDWGPPVKPQVIKISEVDLKRSEFPEQ